jgi:hypothetical protein
MDLYKKMYDPAPAEETPAAAPQDLNEEIPF